MKIETVPAEVISTTNCKPTDQPNVFVDPDGSIVIVGQNEAIKINP